MARPRKIGLDYFPHDVDAANDEKIVGLRALHGNMGYSFYFMVLERIYRQGGELPLKDNDALKILAKVVDVEMERLEVMLEACFKLDLFDRSAFKQRHVLTSEGIRKRMETVNNERERARGRAAKSDPEVDHETGEVIRRRMGGETRERKGNIKSKLKDKEEESECVTPSYPPEGEVPLSSDGKRYLAFNVSNEFGLGTLEVVEYGEPIPEGADTEEVFPAVRKGDGFEVAIAGWAPPPKKPCTPPPELVEGSWEQFVAVNEELEREADERLAAAKVVMTEDQLIENAEGLVEVGLPGGWCASALKLLTKLGRDNDWEQRCHERCGAMVEGSAQLTGKVDWHDFEALLIRLHRADITVEWIKGAWKTTSEQYWPSLWLFETVIERRAIEENLSLPKKVQPKEWVKEGVA
jgi:hypothetical protein